MVICAPSSVVAVKVATHASNLGRAGLEIIEIRPLWYLLYVEKVKMGKAEVKHK